ncbi:hypothetical protein FRB93_006071 [Tulasnella sp. JGI-2019a]|nr:hypothetical protein FRB93_006071 [Tulasnella sp. JGI-2019a]
MSTANSNLHNLPGQPLQTTINTLTGGNAFQQKDVQNLSGRVAIVTGGTAGISYEVAKCLTLAGARVVVLSCKSENGENAVSQIKTLAAEDTKNTVEPDVEFVECDFGNMHKVKEVADKPVKQEKRIDILINDAGVGVNDYGLDEDGIERDFGVNVVGHFLFINQLLPLIRKTAHIPNTPAPRIISLSSNLHQLAPSDTEFASLEEINNPNLSRNDQYYNRSKLAIILYIKALVKNAIEPYSERIFALSVHPGAVDTEIQDQVKSAFGETFGSILLTLQTPFLRTPEEGSIGTLWAALAPEVEEKNYQGVYIPDPGKVGGKTKQAQDSTLEKNVWDLCQKLITDKLGNDGLLAWDEVSK